MAGLRVWLRQRSGMERLVLVWMAGLTLFCCSLVWMHDRAAGRLLRPPPGWTRAGEQRPQTKGGGKSFQRPLVPLSAQAKIALLVLFYGRREYLEQTMDSVLRIVPRDNFAIIMSQDGDVEGMAQFVKRKYAGQAIHIQMNRTKVHLGPMRSYHYISDHFKFALTQVFDVLKFDTAVVLEDDMLVAPDFFQYFAGLAPLLHSDQTLLCVSAWNDNGMRGLVAEDNITASKELRRTSVFPGLGWMLTRTLWDQELRDKWPAAYWDDWLREPAQTRGRDCIFPTVSRSKTIGEIGSSVGQFYNTYLSRIVLNKIPVEWSKESFARLDRQKYKAELLAQVERARTVERRNLEREVQHSTSGSLRVFWKTAKQYAQIADTMGMMNDLKAGLPRSSFEGIVRVLTPKGLHLYVVPDPSVLSKLKKKKVSIEEETTTTASTIVPVTAEAEDVEEEEGEEEEEKKET